MHPLVKILTAMREAQGLTQRELATRASLSPTSVHRVECGGTDPHLSTLHGMADVLGMEIIAVPKELRQELDWFIQAGGKCLGHPPGISAPLSIVDMVVAGTYKVR
ncbi:helix-turn-helix transcriptional regulator [Alcaligenaceae bacterium]|nr:helix-turn-helix transcriptional regulator [Alcaligenaceae bacterium]